MQSADIVSAVQENLKWLKSEKHSFQDGGMNTRTIYFTQQYVLIHSCKCMYFRLLNFGQCLFSGREGGYIELDETSINFLFFIFFMTTYKKRFPPRLSWFLLHYTIVFDCTRRRFFI